MEKDEIDDDKKQEYMNEARDDMSGYNQFLKDDKTRLINEFISEHSSEFCDYAKQIDELKEEFCTNNSDFDEFCRDEFSMAFGGNYNN